VSYLQEARLIQSSLLPTGPLAGPAVEIAYRLTPFFEVGGDFVDFFHLPDGLIGLFLGDVVGKGLPAALYGALVMGTLRGIHKTGTTPRTVLSLLNERLMQRPLSARFCSTLYAAFDPHTRILTFSNAGLPLPSRASAATVDALGEGGIPSALFPAVVYDEYSVPLSPGDCVLFSTDGLQESCNRDGVEFGAQRMAEVWVQCGSKSPQQSLDFLFEELSEFSQGTAPHDDITAVVLKVRS
jgi:sigma-B regulation protein RsbU (phosphoserine phosphatase)